MQTPLQRRKMLVDMGLAEPIPSHDVQRAWAWIDDRVPPEGEADGQFDTHVSWLNHAASWIGWSGSKTYDTKDRRCRNGADFKRALDEDAFPVRWYGPERFPAPVIVDPRTMRIRRAVAQAGDAGISAEEMRRVERLGNVGRAEIGRAVVGRADLVEGRYVMNAAGVEQTEFESLCERHAGYVR